MKKSRKLGFTLLELLVVIAMIAILAAVAVPSAMHFVNKANAKSDEVYFEDVVRVVNSSIMQLKPRPEQIDIHKVLDKTYQSYNGAYNKDNPALSDSGDMPYLMLPFYDDDRAVPYTGGAKYFKVTLKDTGRGKGYQVDFIENGAVKHTKNVAVPGFDYVNPPIVTAP